MAAQYQNRSVSRAFNVLECVSGSEGPLGLAEIARRANLDRSTTLRFLAVLKNLGYVHRDPHDSTYRLGHRIDRLAEHSRGSDLLCSVARPIVTALAGTFGESTYIGTMEGTYMYYRQRVDPPTAARKRTQTDTPFDPVSMIPGRLLLAYRDPGEVEKMYVEGRPLRPVWRNTPTLTALERTLTNIRGDGYYMGELECSPGMYCIAVPVFDSQKDAVCCVTVTGPGARLHRPKVAAYVQRLQGASRSISAQLQ